MKLFSTDALGHRRTIRIAGIAAGLAMGLANLAAAGGAIGPISLNPKRTYLHVNSDAGTLDSIPLVLADLGISPGDRIRITRVGDFDNGPEGDIFVSLLGVFSASSVLLPPAMLHRVQDAIDVGHEIVTAPSFSGSQPTDVPEDFIISQTGGINDLCIVVPPAATHLFLSPHDSKFGDNSDPDGDFGVVFTRIGPCAADFNCDGTVNGLDLAMMLGAWTGATTYTPCTPSSDPDLNHDCKVNGLDLALLLGQWGPCSG